MKPIFNFKTMKSIKWTAFCLLTFAFCFFSANAAQVIATVNGAPITDTDITARTQLMAMQGQTSTDNRRVALQNMIDDQVKLAYAANFKAVPGDSDVAKQLKEMNLSGLPATQLNAAKNAVRAEMAWQAVIGRTIMPTVDVSAEDIAAEKADLERAKGLPIEITMVRLIYIPEDVAKKLSRPASCDAAVKMAEDLGGEPQRFTALEYELSEDIRTRIIGLPLLTWSPRVDSSVVLVCAKKNTKEYGKLDDIIKQNAIYKKASFMADQQLKQLRRKAVVVINDAKYK
ncbi:MAG: SurA N-terminal domain-containing protein [Rickettsiales bacterium]|nr:SurA N-terminal domain-containing protein [Rickettsiales bacterium]